MDEALTEFLAKKALKHFNDDILEKVDNTKSESSCETNYDCMLPLVEILKESVLWDDILWCKLYNDYSLLEDRVGKYASKIAFLFGSVYLANRSNAFNNSSMELTSNSIGELYEVINKIENEIPRYNKSLRK